MLDILNKYKKKIEVRLSVDADEILILSTSGNQTSLEFQTTFGIHISQSFCVNMQKKIMKMFYAF